MLWCHLQITNTHLHSHSDISTAQHEVHTAAGSCNVIKEACQDPVAFLFALCPKQYFKWNFWGSLCVQKNKGLLQYFSQIHFLITFDLNYLSQVYDLINHSQSVCHFLVTLSLFAIYCCNWELTSDVRHHWSVLSVSVHPASWCLCPHNQLCCWQLRAPEELRVQQGWQTAGEMYWTKIVFTSALWEAYGNNATLACRDYSSQRKFPNAWRVKSSLICQFIRSNSSPDCHSMINCIIKSSNALVQRN